MIQHLITEINKNKNLFFFKNSISFITIYDHHIFERSEYDSLSGPQRIYLENFLNKFGFTKTRGRVLTNSELNTLLIYPKPASLSTSPFDVLRDELIETNKIFAVTPTQLACHILLIDDEQIVKDSITKLIKKFPINIKKIKDHLPEGVAKRNFIKLQSLIQTLQQESIDKAINEGRSHLGRVF